MTTIKLMYLPMLDAG